jgi:hypothetical protein
MPGRITALDCFCDDADLGLECTSVNAAVCADAAELKMTMRVISEDLPDADCGSPASRAGAQLLRPFGDLDLAPPFADFGI